jgi:hypothetical protein
MLARLSSAALAVAVVSFAGCGPAKLDVNKTYTLDEPKIVLLDAQPKVQNIKVDFESDNPVTILLIKDADLAKGEDGSTLPASKALASKVNEKSGSFTAEVPANSASRVLLKNNGAKATVKLHITN